MRRDVESDPTACLHDGCPPSGAPASTQVPPGATIPGSMEHPGAFRARVAQESLPGRQPASGYLAGCQLDDRIGPRKARHSPRSEAGNDAHDPELPYKEKVNGLPYKGGMDRCTGWQPECLARRERRREHQAAKPLPKRASQSEAGDLSPIGCQEKTEFRSAHPPGPPGLPFWGSMEGVASRSVPSHGSPV